MGPLSPASPPATAPFPSGAHAGLTAALSAPAYSLTTAPTGKGQVECTSKNLGSGTWINNLELCLSVPSFLSRPNTHRGSPNTFSTSPLSWPWEIQSPESQSLPLE